MVGLQALVVNAHHESGGVVLGGGRKDHFFRACRDVFLSIRLGEKKACRLNNNLSADLVPFRKKSR